MKHRAPLPRIAASVLIALSYLAACPGVCAAQDARQQVEAAARPPAFTVDNWQTDDGLPQSSVKAIAQTPDGYLWMVTFNGLVRFDGVRFVVYDTSNLPGLPNNRLVDLAVEKSGALWILSEFSDLARLEKGHCRPMTDRDGIPPDGVRWVTVTPAGEVWIAGAKRGLRVWRDGRFVPIAVPPEFEKAPVDRMVAEASGRIWFLQGTRLLEWTGAQFQPLTAPAGSIDVAVNAVAARRDQGLWILTKDGLRTVTAGQWGPIVATHPGIGTAVVGIEEDPSGNLWIATYASGLLRFHRSRGWTRIAVEDGLTTISLRSLRCDREGNVWVGTDGGGLLRVKPRLWRMVTSRDGLGISAVHAVAQDQQGRIWFAGGTNTPYGLLEGVVSAALKPPVTDPMRGVWSVVAARSGAVWIGTYPGKVFRVEQGRAVEFGETEGMRAGSVRALFEDRSGALWVGGTGGLSRIDRGTIANYSTAEGLTSNRIQALAEDSRGRLYIGTSDAGLNVLEQGRISSLDRRQGLPDNVVASIVIDRDDTVWIGTHGGGLSRLVGNRFFNYYDVKGGLPARGIGPMVEDDDGYLWISSSIGIIRTKKSELSEFAAGKRAQVNYVVFDRSDGLETVEVGGIQPACMKARDGSIWFGTAKGAAVVKPSDVTINPLPPSVLIEEVRVDDTLAGAGEGREASPVGGVSMSPGQRRLEIRFTGLSYAAPTRVRFRYRMEGFDPDWVDGGDARTATYTRLPPGHYPFRVTARNNDGVWNEAGASLAVDVWPAFYQTWWFPLLMVAAVAGVIWAAFAMRLARLKQIAQLRARIAGDLHDEVGSNLGGIILLSGIAKEDAGLSADTQESLEEINATAQRTANAVRDIVWFLNPGVDTLPDMVIRMREFSRTLLAGADVEFTAPAGLPSSSLPLEFRRNLFFAFKEIVHNISKHAAATRVEVRVELAGRDLRVRVTDNGRGFDPDAKSSGHGLRSLQQRAADVGGSVRFESAAGKGCRVTLSAVLPS